MAKKWQQSEEEVSMEHSAPAKLHPNFDSFWLELKNKNSLRDSVKESLRKYFQGLGVLEKPSKYAQAAKTFGLKVA
jgi:hypothetical protein